MVQHYKQHFMEPESLEFLQADHNARSHGITVSWFNRHLTGSMFIFLRTFVHFLSSFGIRPPSHAS